MTVPSGPRPCGASGGAIVEARVASMVAVDATSWPRALDSASSELAASNAKSCTRCFPDTCWRTTAHLCTAVVPLGRRTATRLRLRRIPDLVK